MMKFRNATLLTRNPGGAFGPFRSTCKSRKKKFFLEVGKMKKLLSKYSNVLELIQEKGKIPMRCIEDGDLEALTNEIEALGYRCRLDPSTDFLVVE